MSLVLVKEAFRETNPESETQTLEPLACSAAVGKVEMEKTPATTNNATEITVTPNGCLELVKTCFTQELHKFCSGLCLLVHSKVFNRLIWFQMAEENIPLVIDGYAPGHIWLNM